MSSEGIKKKQEKIGYTELEENDYVLLKFARLAAKTTTLKVNCSCFRKANS